MKRFVAHVPLMRCRRPRDARTMSTMHATIPVDVLRLGSNPLHGSRQTGGPYARREAESMQTSDIGAPVERICGGCCSSELWIVPNAEKSKDLQSQRTDGDLLAGTDIDRLAAALRVLCNADERARNVRGVEIIARFFACAQRSSSGAIRSTPESSCR